MEQRTVETPDPSTGPIVAWAIKVHTSLGAELACCYGLPLCSSVCCVVDEVRPWI